MTKGVSSPDAGHGQSDNSTFNLKPKLPESKPGGYTLQAAKGLRGRNVLKALLKDPDEECSNYLASLDGSGRRKAHTSMYNCYLENVGGGKERRSERVRRCLC
jgi:hypothetical protein